MATELLQVGTEIYWPKAPNPQVYQITQLRENRCILSPDFGPSTKDWKLDELLDNIERGYTEIFTGAPRRARQKLHHVDGEWCMFQHIYPFQFDGVLYWVGETTYTERFVGAVDAVNFRLVRGKKRERLTEAWSAHKAASEVKP